MDRSRALTWNKRKSLLLAALDLARTPLLVVDDVLYEGHSLLRTCAYLAQLGARRVHTAVLVDRCVSIQPIHADIVGIRLQVAPLDIVECHVPPYEPDLRIEIVRHGQSPSRHTSAGRSSEQM